MSSLFQPIYFGDILEPIDIRVEVHNQAGVVILYPRHSLYQELKGYLLATKHAYNMPMDFLDAEERMMGPVKVQLDPGIAIDCFKIQVKPGLIADRLEEFFQQKGWTFVQVRQYDDDDDDDELF